MPLNVLQHAARAQHLVRTLGTRCAAGFLRNRGVGLDHALQVLGFPARRFTAEGRLV
jgi:hypothetical protein